MSQQYDKMVTNQRKLMLYFLAIAVAGVGFASSPRIFQGLVLGGVLGFYNLWLLQRKTKQLGEVSASNQKMMGIGTFSRLASAAIAVLITLRFEEEFHIIAVVIGLAMPYVIIMLEFGYRVMKKKVD